MHGTDEDGVGIGSRKSDILALQRVGAVDADGIMAATGNQWGQGGPGTRWHDILPSRKLKRRAVVVSASAVVPGTAPARVSTLFSVGGHVDARKV